MVLGFMSSLSSKQVLVVNTAVAYDDQAMGDSYILLVYNAQYIQEMINNLIPPFLIRLAQFQVNEKPKLMA